MVVSGYWPSQAPYEEFPLPELLRRSAERFGDKPALIGADGTTRTYGELWSHARKVARLLQDNGIEKGDKVGIFSPNLVDYASVFYGALLAGATVTTLNPLYREREIEHQLDDAEAVALFVFSPMGAPVEAARHNLPRLRHVWPIDGLPELVGGVPEDYRPVPINPREDVAVLPYSSGTTGLPKGVMLTHYNIACNVKQGLAARSLTSDIGQPVRAALLPHLRDDGALEHRPRPGRHRHRDDALRRGADAASRRQAPDDQPLPGAAGQSWPWPTSRTLPASTPLPCG